MLSGEACITFSLYLGFCLHVSLQTIGQLAVEGPSGLPQGSLRVFFPFHRNLLGSRPVIFFDF